MSFNPFDDEQQLPNLLVEAEIERLKQVCSEKDAELLRINRLVRDLESQNSSIIAKMLAVSKELENCKNSKASDHKLESKLNEYFHQLVLLRTDNEQLLKKNDSLQEAHANLESSYKDNRAELIFCRRELEDKEKDDADTKASLERMKKDLSQAQKTINRLQIETRTHATQHVLKPDQKPQLTNEFRQPIKSTEDSSQELIMYWKKNSEAKEVEINMLKEQILTIQSTRSTSQQNNSQCLQINRQLTSDVSEIPLCFSSFSSPGPYLTDVPKDSLMNTTIGNTEAVGIEYFEVEGRKQYDH